jgi:hypothetical protein
LLKLSKQKPIRCTGHPTLRNQTKLKFYELMAVSTPLYGSGIPVKNVTEIQAKHFTHTKCQRMYTKLKIKVYKKN